MLILYADLAKVGATPQWWGLCCIWCQNHQLPPVCSSSCKRGLCHALKVTVESIPTAGNVAIPSCFSFACLKGSSSGYWAINRKTPWLHLWLLLCRSNIRAAVITLCIPSLREKEKSKTKAAGSRVLKESRNLSTSQSAGLFPWQVEQVSLHQVKGGEEKRLLKLQPEISKEIKLSSTKERQSSSPTLQHGCYPASWKHLSPSLGWTQQMPRHIHIFSFKVKQSLHQGFFYFKSFLIIIKGRGGNICVELSSFRRVCLD